MTPDPALADDPPLASALCELAAAAPDHDHDGADPTALCVPLARHGLFVAALPAAEGGRGWATDPGRTGELVRALLGLGAADLSAGRIFEGHLNAVKLVGRYGDPVQAAALAEAVRAGAVCGVWNAEGAQPLALDAAPGAKGAGRLTGGKIYCSGIGLVTRPVVTARGPEGVHMLLPRLPDPLRADLGGWTVQGMRATATGSVDLTGLKIKAAEVVGAPGDYYRAPLFKGGAWRFAAVHAGAVARLAALVRGELRARGRDADPHQLARAGALALAAETAELWVLRAAEVLEGAAEADAPAAEAYANLARTAVERAAMEAIALAQRALGLSALTRPSPVERIARDLATYLRQPFPDGALDEAARFTLATAGAPPWSRTPEVDG